MKFVLFLALMVLLGVDTNAQGYIPSSYVGMPAIGYYRPLAPDTSSTKKWTLNKYAGLNAGFMAFKGGSASYVSAPVGLQLNRKITNNVYAFAGVNVAPALVNFNSAFLNSNKFSNANPFMYRPNNLGMYGRAELGLMYTNDERTFQISGSFGVERSTFPQPAGFYNQQRTRQLPAVVK